MHGAKAPRRRNERGREGERKRRVEWGPDGGQEERVAATRAEKRRYVGKGETME